MILSQLKKDAEDYLGIKVTSAVITVPAYFTASQKEATKQAAEIAGEFTKRAIEKTVGDENHKYGVKFEQVIPELSNILK